MHIEEKIQALSALGKNLHAIDNDGLTSLAQRAAQHNPWFTEESIRQALTGIRKMLEYGSLSQWVSYYSNLGNNASKTVALVLAGNIPLVGFHDILSILISGHSALIKLSSKDDVLIPFVLDLLVQTEPRFKTKISFTDQIKNFDAVIATGSDNSARYFEYYFSKYPHIIRKNRSSVAILQGNESEEELELLGRDIFSYFGLGCRNVSKLYVPEGYALTDLFPRWDAYADIIHHHKYCNNYDYQKAILMVNKTPFYDNGFLLTTASDKLVSPIAVLFYEPYSSFDGLKENLEEQENKIQCIVGSAAPATVGFGQAQFPEVNDYADRVDTLAFLQSLN